jgi:hypothetical protein
MLSDVTFILFCEDIENIIMDGSYEQTIVSNFTWARYSYPVFPGRNCK